MKKVISLLLALVMVMGLATTAFAATIDIASTTGDTGVSVKGKTFKAYQILTAEVITAADGTKSTLYKVPDALEDTFVTELNKIITDNTKKINANSGSLEMDIVNAIADLESNSDTLFDFAATMIAAAKAANTANDGSVLVKSVENVAGETATIDVGTDLGYYVVEDATQDNKNGTTEDCEVISAVMVQSITDDIDIYVKAEQPPLNKWIDAKNDTDPDNNTDEDGVVKFNNTSFGDTVPYIVNSEVPDMINYDKYFFVVNDTLSKGLTLNANTIKITIGNVELTKDTHYTATTSTNTTTGETTLKIVFNNFVRYQTQEVDGAEGSCVGDAIKITYSATVNTDAVVGIAGNPNKVTLTYSRNPNVEYNGTNEPVDTDPVGITPEDKTWTYVTDVNIIKVDPAGNRLTGAKFKLEGTRTNTVVVVKETFTKITGEAPEGVDVYYKLKDGSYTTTVPGSIVDGEEVSTDKYESTVTTYIKTVETEEIEKTQDVSYEAVVDAQGKLNLQGLGAGEYTITELIAPDGYNLLEGSIKLVIGWTAPTASHLDAAAPCTWSYTWTANNSNDANKIKAGTGDNANTITVVNTTGATLPTTGGMGTTLFYVFGAIMVLGAAVLLVTKKRMTAE